MTARATIEEARRVGDIIGVDWRVYDVEQFRKGMDVEREHGSHDPQTDVSHDDPLITGKIALAHMKEFPDYYVRLERMEEEAKRAEPRREQWAAASGFGAIAFGIAAAALERPWPTHDPAAFALFIADNRVAIVAQSILFIIGAGFYIWFLGSLRSFLIPAEGGTGRLSMVAFGAGMIWVSLNILGQAPQITLALPSPDWMQPALAQVLADLCYVVLTIANWPLAIMFSAVAVVSLRSTIFPRWLGWLAVVAAAAALVLSFAVVHPSGPLAPQGWLTLVLYPAPIIWLVPATVVMIRRAGMLRSRRAPDLEM